jgi:phage terminase large subunit
MAKALELVIDTPRVFKPLLAPARYKGAYGGRGSGKSHFFAEMLIRRCVSAKTHVVCVREIQESLQQSVKKLLEAKIEALRVGKRFTVMYDKIIGANGSLITFSGMRNHTAESIKSLEGFDVAWVEEAQSLSQRSLDLLRPTIRKEASEIWFSWNPNHATDPVDVLLRGDNPPHGTICVEANYRSNPWLPKVLLEELEYDRKRDPDKFAHVWLGGYQRNSEARVFRNWRIEEFEVKPEWVLRQGADWGFSIDPSVLVQAAIEGRTLYVPHEAYMIGCEIDFLPELFRTVPDAERWPTVADSARPETISYMQRHGFPRMLPAVKGAKSLEEGVEFLKSFDIVVHPRCTHLIDELTLYSYKTDPLTGAVIPVLRDADNHVIDSLRYACEGARRSAKRPPAEARGHRPLPMPESNSWMSF